MPDNEYANLQRRYDAIVPRVDKWLNNNRRTPAWLAKELKVERSVLARFLNDKEPNYKPRPSRPRMIEILEGLEQICVDERRDIFLSHRSTDKDFVRQLAADIEADESGRKITVWLDEAEIQPGQSIPAAVSRAIDVCHYFGLVLSPDYFESPSGWTDAEWHSFLYNDPDNRRCKLLPLLAVECPVIPPLLRHLLLIDLRPKNYDRGLKQLLATIRGEPLPRPTAVRGQLIRPGRLIDRGSLIAERAVPDADPDTVSERLYCNLLPIEKLPQYVFSAPISRRLRRTTKSGTSSIPRKPELIDYVRQAQQDAGLDRPRTPAFRQHEDCIVTFHDLESPDSLLAPIVDQEHVEVEDVRQYLVEESKRNLILSLLNMAIERHASRRGLVHDRTRFHRFFFPPDNGGPRVISWTPFRKKAQRTVTKPDTRGGEINRWMHQACYIRATFLASRIYIQLVPTRLLTTDGNTAIGGSSVSKTPTRILNQERNLHVFYHNRFWTNVLREGPGPISIRAGDQWIDVSVTPAFVEQDFGIAGDSKNFDDLLDQEAPRIAELEDELSSMPDLAGVDDDNDAEAAEADLEEYRDEQE